MKSSDLVTDALRHLNFSQPIIPELKIPPLPPSPFITNMEANYASEFYKRLVDWIKNFDANLDQTHEVGVRLVNFGQTVTFHLEDMSYWNPSLISFTGRKEDGQPVELIQHVSQISILLTSLPRENPNQPKSPIGFSAETTPEDTERLGTEE